MTNETKFHPRKHHNLVLDNARKLGFKGTQLNILRVMCWEGSWKTPTVEISQGFIAQETGHHVSTVKATIKALRDAGVIIPIANPRGGRHRNKATTFKLWAKSPVGSSVATNSEENAVNGSSVARQLVASDSSIGSDIPLQPKGHKNHREEIEEGTSRAQHSKGVTDEQREDMRLFSQWTLKNGYAEASRLLKARQALRGD